jgi:adenylate cyclase
MMRATGPGIAKPKADRPHLASPYLALSTGAPVITVSAPLPGKVPGVLAADLKFGTSAI